MKVIEQRLPTYIANCFSATGFDDLQSIREMDTCNGPNNSIKVIEEYIDKRKIELPLCMGPMHSSTLPFEFHPGHHIRIIKLINEIQDKYSGPTGYLKLAPAESCNKTAKK